MVAPLGAAATAVVPVATVVAAAAIAPVVMAIATMIVAAETVTVAAMIATGTAMGAATGTIVVLAIATIALRFGRCGGAEAESRKGEPCGDEMRKLHDVSSCPRSGWKDDTILLRHRS